MGGTYYSLDKSTGSASTVSSIPLGGATITWNGQGLPPELQTALGKPAASTPAVSPSVSNATPTYGAVNNPPNVAQPNQTQKSTTAPAVPSSVYASARAQIAAGADPITVQNSIQSMINSGQYSGGVDTSTLFAPLTVVKNGASYGLNPDGSFKTLTAAVQNNTVGAGGTTTTTTTPAAAPTSTTAKLAPVAPTYTATYAPTGPANAATPASTTVPAAATAAPITTAPTPPTTGIASSLPGGTATTLYDYYSAQGKALPTVSARSTLFEQLGLGTAGAYKGTAAQNEELLSALQRQDISQHNLGGSPLSTVTPPGSATTGGVDATPAGTSLASALAGSNASDTLASYKTYVASALGVATDKLNSDTNALNDFFSTEKDATSILNDAMSSAGIPAQQSLLTELDTQITSQTKTLENLPNDIKNTLADVGVSQAQLDRLVAKETKGPTQVLNDLLTQRNATASEIDKATSFASQFANTQIASQAAKLAALEWMVTSDKSDVSNLDADAKTVIAQGIADQKTIMTTALTAAKNGASNDVIQGILSATSPEAAAATAGSYLVTPAKTPGTGTMSSDIKKASSVLEVGGYGGNGRGPDGYVDPTLYTLLYNQALNTYGAPGAAAFIAANPPGKDINPAYTGALPEPIKNAVAAAKTKKTSSSGVSDLLKTSISNALMTVK